MSVVFSMTGFANVQGVLEGQASYTLTLKSVNHRFLDLNLRLPSQCDGLEVQIRRVLKERLRRGHVEFTLQLDRRSGGQMQVNPDVLGSFVKAYRDAAAVHGVMAEPDINAILRIPGVMTSETSFTKDDLPALEGAVVEQLEPLVEKLNAMRASEGGALAAELRASMGRLAVVAAEVVELRSGIREAQFERLRGRIVEMMQGAAVSEERLLTEAALLAERSDVEEEVIRLQTHVGRFVAILDEGGEVGKKLDFLLQELNREANTLLSKTSGAVGGNGLRITELGLEMKAEIEKAREQVQNLE